MRIRFGDYGMVLVLLLLCALFSLLTLKRQSPDGPSAASFLVKEIAAKVSSEKTVIVFGKKNTSYADLAESVAKGLERQQRSKVTLVIGEPRDLRDALDALREEGGNLGAIATAGPAAEGVIGSLASNYPEFKDALALMPEESLRSTFFSTRNFLAVVERVVIIAIIAIGMTMVIITAGIDLSVGSLIALSAVICATTVRNLGGEEAPYLAVLAGIGAAVLTCGLVGAIAGGIVARFKVAAFIVTLGIMMMARGQAKLISGGYSILEVPPSFRLLAHGSLLGIPNTILLLFVMYVAAHVFMQHTKYGRYIYAVGGNPEAARLSGVPVAGVIVFVYTVCGLMSGLGGCIQASLVNGADATMGQMVELAVIAAVVVGGTSLFGGSGRIFGTLIGALIIAVMQNGMNLLNIRDAVQEIVLGAVIVIAVLLDRARQSGGIRKLLATP